VRRLAVPAVSGGFKEVDAAVAPVLDPSDAEHTLDTFYEITYAKRAGELHERAHQFCFIANSVNFPVRCELPEVGSAEL